MSATGISQPQLKPGAKLKENLSIIFTMEFKLKY
jgi:hypothetical protein